MDKDYAMTLRDKLVGPALIFLGILHSVRMHDFTRPDRILTDTEIKAEDAWRLAEALVKMRPK